MSYSFSMIFSFSIAIAAIMGWVRYKKMDPAFYPFLILITMATYNEIMSAIIIHYKYSNASNSNVYSFIEALCIQWQFRNWRLFRRPAKSFSLICIFLFVVWFSENFLIASIKQFNSYFIIVYGFITVMMSISMINRLMVNDEPYISIRSILLICFCFSIYYTYSVFIEIFWIWGSGASKTFRLNIYRILCYINLLTNLAYALSILWIPGKRKFLKLY